MTPEQDRSFSREGRSWSSGAATRESPAQSPAPPSIGATTGAGAGSAPPRPANPAAGSPPEDIQAEVKSLAADAQHHVEKTIVQVRDQVREQGKSQLASQKDRVADTVGSVANALKETSKQLQQSDDTPVAEYVDRLAHGIDRFSQHLRQRDVDELIADAESFARRQPALFLSGAFFIGLAAARFLKSSRPQPPSSPYTNGSSMSLAPRSTPSMPYANPGGYGSSRPAQPPASMGPRSSE